MIKANQTVINETMYISTWAVIFSFIMQAVFLAIGKWNYTVLLGNLWGVFITILNFFLMGLFIQKAVEKKEEEEAKKIIKLSYNFRVMLLVLLVILGIVVPFIHTISMLISLLFARFGIFMKMFQLKRTKEAAKQDA